jgi:NAD(P)H dehydrogenase (quinone)
MRVFIVHAHHKPRSFNGSLTREASAVLDAAGHSVLVSDLYAMGFNPVSDRSNFITAKDPNYLHQQTEEIHASENDGFSPDIKVEMDKLSWCDVLILQFPLWWFGCRRFSKVGLIESLRCAGPTEAGGITIVGHLPVSGLCVR